MSNGKQSAYGTQRAEDALRDASFLVHETRRLVADGEGLDLVRVEREMDARVDTISQSFPKMTVTMTLIGIKTKPQETQ